MWVDFDDLSLQSRVWVFQSNRFLAAEEQDSIDTHLKSYIEQWSTHGAKMHASHLLLHNCFVVISADEQKQAASGCSIDSLTALFKKLGEQYNLSLSIDSSESSIHYNLANAYFKKENFEDAIVSYKNVVNLEPDKFKATHKIGVCYQKLDLHDEAVVEFKNAIGTVERLDEKFMSLPSGKYQKGESLGGSEKITRLNLIIVNVFF